ncbi:MAG TPA: DUF4331 family protein [Bacteroidia bacterium]|nr:DUF4331 family protein [Bacteroidia bacterium]
MFNTKSIIKTTLVLAVVAGCFAFGIRQSKLTASSHREAPLIADDPIADNTDLYAFRSPDDSTTVTIIAAYNPIQLAQGGPNYYQFGEDVRYEIHIKNSTVAPTTDDITYRFTFSKTNEDPSTFFNIRLGQQNLKTTYKMERWVRKVGGGYSTWITNGAVPPANIGPRSINDPVLGLGKTYQQLVGAAITTSTSPEKEKVYCGPADDPFFVDLGGIFDLGQTRAGGTGINAPEDGIACRNVNVIAIKVPIKFLQKDGKNAWNAQNILDPNFVVGVWASASRPKISTLNTDGTKPTTSGYYVQVSRLGMPLTNEAVIPLGSKDKWNSLTPYKEDPAMEAYFCNPELGLYMDDSLFGGAVPGLAALRIQRASPTILGNVDFGNNNDGLHVLYGHPATTGTALDTAIFGKYLLRAGQPRSVDLLPIFYTGVPNLAPYQLATGKTAGNPLSAGKPFINNFLPTFGDMLRLNMAVPVTPRNHPKFSSLGIIAAAVEGLTNPVYANTNMEWIPNMDGFPNGRRLEDDVTRIELQAVSGAALAAVGLWYDDYTIGQSPLTPGLVNVLGYTTGIESNDLPFKKGFPYVANPWSGYGKCGGPKAATNGSNRIGMNVGVPTVVLMQNYPNPCKDFTKFTYHVSADSYINISIYNTTGELVTVLVNEGKATGDHEVVWNLQGKIAPGVYYASITSNNTIGQTLKVNVTK